MKIVPANRRYPALLQAIHRFLESRRPWQIWTLGLAAVSGLAWLDHVTTHAISLSIFQLLPIALATWYAPPPLGSLTALIAVALWLYHALFHAHVHEPTWVVFWNAAVRIIFYLLFARVLGALKSALRRERNVARIDGLTWILNVRGFHEACERLFQLAARHHRPTTLAFIDLDNFKRVNDTRGHAAGDRVLQDVAATLTANVRATDVVGRLGGDEFAVFMPETGLNGARTAFAKIQQELQLMAAAEGHPVGFSIGVAVFPAAPPSLADAIRVADALMYRVKRSGKNNLVCEEQPGAHFDAQI